MNRLIDDGFAHRPFQEWLLWSRVVRGAARCPALYSAASWERLQTNGFVTRHAEWWKPKPKEREKIY